MRTFQNWYQEKLEVLQFNRVGTMMFMFLFHGNVTAPATLIALFNNGADPLQFFLCIVGSFAIIVPNLSVSPMRITVPIFILGTLMHWIILLMNLAGL